MYTKKYIFVFYNLMHGSTLNTFKVKYFTTILLSHAWEHFYYCVLMFNTRVVTLGIWRLSTALMVGRAGGPVHYVRYELDILNIFSEYS